MKMLMADCKLVVAVLLVLFLATCHSYGAYKCWQGANGAKWNVANNWNPSGVPTDNGDDLVFNTTNHCLIDSTVTNAAGTYIDIGFEGTGYLDITGGLLNAYKLVVGYGYTGTIAMHGGTVNVATQTYVGRYGSSGLLSMAGGHWWTQSAYIAFYDGDTGELHMDGGIFEVNSPNFYMKYYGGTATVSINGDAKLIIHDSVPITREDDILSYIENGWITTHNSGHVIAVDGNSISGLITITATPIFYVDDFGASGDGTTDDTNAFYAASQAIDAAGGGTLHLGNGKTYRVGKQIHTNGVYPYYVHQPMILIDGAIDHPVRILGHGSTLKLNNLRFGSFDPNTGLPYDPNGPFTNPDYIAAVGDIIHITDCNIVEINDLIINGNSDNLTLGGTWGGDGYECGPGHGVFLSGNNTVNISDVNSHHNAIDGFYIWDPDATVGVTKMHILTRIQSCYNARQGLSWTGGVGLTVSDSNFSHTGKGAFSSAPGCGVDIEPTASLIRNGQFTNCEFIDNAGFGMGSGANDVEDVNFTDCLFWGTTYYSIAVECAGFKFNNCDIYGSVYHAYGSNNADEATQYKYCTFDDTNSFTRTALLMLEGQNVKFDHCEIIANNAPSTYVWDNSTKEIFTDCNIYNYADGLADCSVQAYLAGSSLTNTIFHESLGNNTYMIQLDKVIVESGVVVDGPRCKWASFWGLTGTIPQGYLWNDNFESGYFSVPGSWTTLNSDSTIIANAKYSGTYGAELAKTTWIEKTISTVGYSSVHIKYNRKTSDLDSGENLCVEWSTDGSNWINLETTNATSWSAQDKTCASGADNNTNFRVRFRTNANLTTEYAYVDDVIVTGTKQ